MKKKKLKFVLVAIFFLAIYILLQYLVSRIVFSPWEEMIVGSLVVNLLLGWLSILCSVFSRILKKDRSRDSIRVFKVSLWISLLLLTFADILFTRDVRIFITIEQTILLLLPTAIFLWVSWMMVTHWQLWIFEEEYMGSDTNKKN